MKNQQKRNHPDRDIVMTPPELARQIVSFLKPSGRVLDPCRGRGAFYDAFPRDCKRLWCEKSEKRDFFSWTEKVDWIISNPPWSLVREFLIHAYSCADHVAFLFTIEHAWLTARVVDMHVAGFGMKDIIVVQNPYLGGKLLGMIHYQRGYADTQVGLFWPWHLGSCDNRTPAAMLWLEDFVRTDKDLSAETRKAALAGLKGYKRSDDYNKQIEEQAVDLTIFRDAVRNLLTLTNDQLAKRRFPLRTKKKKGYLAKSLSQ